MTNYPAWKDMTDHQKLEFLYEWCERMSREIQSQGGWIHGLHARLEKVEAKVASERT
jgi:hypothetical protein